MVRWGILGCGKIAQKFANDLNRLDGCKLVAVGSRSLAKAETFRIKNKAIFGFGSYQDLASCHEVDVVYIATPHTMHKENTLLCLNHGKHVLCEKPLAINAKQVEAMINAAKVKQLFLMEAIWTQFLPFLSKLKEIIADGVLGEIKMIEADFGFKAEYNPMSRLFDPNLGGGALLDIGIYPLFLCQTLLGPPDDIKASAVIGKTGVDESIGIILKWKNGAMANLNCTLHCDTNCSAKIFGTKRTANISPRWHESNTINLTERNDLVKSYTFDDEYIGYAYEIMEVNQCISNSEIESKQLPLSFSYDLMQIMDEIRDQIGLKYPIADDQ